MLRFGGKEVENLDNAVYKYKLTRRIFEGWKYIEAHPECVNKLSRQAAIDAVCLNNFHDITLVGGEPYTKGYRDGVLTKENDCIENIMNLPSAQSESEDTTFWKNRAREYEEKAKKLIDEMARGVKIDSVALTEGGIVIKYKQPGTWRRISTQAALCSCCGMAVNAKMAKQFRYCPFCGARMEEEDGNRKEL